MNDFARIRRPFQYSLFTLFVTMTAVAICLGLAVTVISQVTELRGNLGWVSLGAFAVALSTCWQWRRIAAGHRGIRWRLAHVALCLYLPFSWILFLNPWSTTYHLLWLKLWAVLPGFVPGVLLFHPRDTPEFATMGIVTILLLAGLTWLSGRGRYALIAATVMGLASAIYSSAFAYTAFRA